MTSGKNLIVKESEILFDTDTKGTYCIPLTELSNINVIRASYAANPIIGFLFGVIFLTAPIYIFSNTIFDFNIPTNVDTRIVAYSLKIYFSMIPLALFGLWFIYAALKKEYYFTFDSAKGSFKITVQDIYKKGQLSTLQKIQG